MLLVRGQRRLGLPTGNRNVDFWTPEDSKSAGITITWRDVFSKAVPVA
jgi:hypothetical protein